MQNLIILTNKSTDSITMIDEYSMTVIKHLAVGRNPHEIAIAPDSKHALISCFNTLEIIDLEYGVIKRTIELPLKSRPNGIKFVSDFEALVAVDGIQSLLVVNIDKETIVGMTQLPGKGAFMVTVDNYKQYAYVTNRISGDLIKIDLKTFNIVNKVKIGRSAECIAVTGDDKRILVTSKRDNVVVIIDSYSLDIVRKIKTDKSPISIQIFNNSGFVVVINKRSGTAQIINLCGLEIIKTFKTTKYSGKFMGVTFPLPIAIAVRSDQKTAYIMNSGAGNITLVDLEKGRVLKTFYKTKKSTGFAITDCYVEDATIYDIWRYD